MLNRMQWENDGESVGVMISFLLHSGTSLFLFYKAYMDIPATVWGRQIIQYWNTFSFLFTEQRL